MTDVTFLNLSRTKSELILFADHLERKLNGFGQINLLAASIRITPTNLACEILNAALYDLSAGWPIPAFDTYAKQARSWTEIATLPERKNYLAAIWQSLNLQDQSAFWQYVQERTAA